MGQSIHSIQIYKTDHHLLQYSGTELIRFLAWVGGIGCPPFHSRAINITLNKKNRLLYENYKPIAPDYVTKLAL